MRDGEGGGFAFGARRNQPLLAVDFVLQIGLLRGTSDGNGPQLDSVVPASDSWVGRRCRSRACSACDHGLRSRRLWSLLGLLLLCGSGCGGRCGRGLPQSQVGDIEVFQATINLGRQEAVGPFAHRMLFVRAVLLHRDVHLLLLVVILQSEAGILRVLNLSSRDSGAFSGWRRTL